VQRPCGHLERNGSDQLGLDPTDTTNVDGTPPGPSTRTPAGHWRAHPVASIAIRTIVVLLPAAAAVVCVALLGRATTPPVGPARILWIGGLFAVGTAIALTLERLARRVLPLAVLLQLSLAFPDRAPSRFAMARTAGNVRRLHERVAEAQARGIDDDPARAARQILELVAALSAHDRKTRGHSERVRAYTDMLASELHLDDEDRDRLRWAALLHDIGKLHVPGRILNKPGKPDAGEWERLAAHPAEGAAIAAPLLPWLGRWSATIVQHHERFDGGGYPAGLEGEEISLGARVVSVADSFEVMTAARAYKKPMTVAAARRELARCAGTQFDPDIVRSFLNISIGRLWWTVGPASWAAVIPVLGWLERSGEQLAIALKTAAIVGALGIAGSVQSAAALGAPPPGAGSGASADVTTLPAPSPGPVPSEAAGGGGSVDGAADGVHDPAEAHEPSPSASPTGSPTPGGGGIGDTTGDLTNTVSDTVSSVSDAVDGTVDGVTDAVDQTTGGATSSTTGTVDQTVRSASETVQETVRGLGL
jgi:putative nucleotidyltransferase with HDIG domain